MLRLKATSPSEWLDAVLSDFNAFLIDHAACERKASATALHLIQHYPDREALVDAMVALSVEELEHFRGVYTWIKARGTRFGPDHKDPYVGALRRLSRGGTLPYFLDRLLIAGIIEARGCERFAMIADALDPGPLKDFYLDITRSEARHHELFVRLARTYFPAAEVEERLETLLNEEARIMKTLPPRAAVH